ncbi:MAG: hypothetical protein BWX50_01424 [Euryarchaeota archaeon ADurb.Bin009]|nr:MAG: hypothetical protein BWX50_01424 [Euryarchaeota archaeon ADurb.Bin009]
MGSTPRYRSGRLVGGHLHGKVLPARRSGEHLHLHIQRPRVPPDQRPPRHPYLEPAPEHPGKAREARETEHGHRDLLLRGRDLAPRLHIGSRLRTARTQGRAHRDGGLDAGDVCRGVRPPPAPPLRDRRRCRGPAGPPPLPSRAAGLLPPAAREPCSPGARVLHRSPQGGLPPDRRTRTPG